MINITTIEFIGISALLFVAVLGVAYAIGIWLGLGDK